MLKRLWNLLDARERRRIIASVPMLVLTALVEVVGVAAVIPFLALLADPGSAGSLPLIGPWLQGTGITDSVAMLRWTGVGLAVLTVVANGLVILTYSWLYHFAWGLNHSLSARLLRHYLAQPYIFTVTQNTASLANKLIVEIRELVLNGVQAGLEVIARGFVIVAIVGFLILLDPVLALAVFLVLGAAYGGIFLTARQYLKRIGAESVKAGAERMKVVNEALGGFKDLKVTGRESSVFRQFEGPSTRYAQVQASSTVISALPRYALEAVAVGGLVLIASIMAGREGSFSSALPLLGAYAFAGLRLMPAVQLMFNAVSRMRFATGSLDAVEADILAMGAREGDLESLPQPMGFDSSIEVEDVVFRYVASEPPTLKHVTLEIRKGVSLAVLGRTGSGKTTLIDVLLGLLVPEQGRLMVDGREVGSEDRRAYRRLFGYVSQSIFLLDDTITRNVAFGLPDDEIEMDAVRRACAQAQIADFIEGELPEGYDTVVGERGVRLSGGQRQRIGIARALYGDPQVLVFDEATSALDVHTERQVYQALDNIARTHTVVTIAHRLETVSKADHVVVLEHGRVVDQGPPTEVLARYEEVTPSQN